jgi:hypothetical protein
MPASGLAKEARSFKGTAMAKRPAPKSPAKKIAKADAPAIKPVKQSLTKSSLINLIAEENEIPRKAAVGVYKSIENAFLGSVHPRGLGRIHASGPSEGQPSQGAGSQSGNFGPQSRHRRNDQGSGETRERSSEDSRAIQVEGGCCRLKRKSLRTKRR